MHERAGGGRLGVPLPLSADRGSPGGRPATSCASCSNGRTPALGAFAGGSTSPFPYKGGSGPSWLGRGYRPALAAMGARSTRFVRPANHRLIGHKHRFRPVSARAVREGPVARVPGQGGRSAVIGGRRGSAKADRLWPWAGLGVRRDPALRYRPRQKPRASPLGARLQALVAARGA